jgi:hypothetical protein
MNTINEKDLIYLAGFLDADGSIYARLVYHKDYDKKKPFQISLTIQYTQKTKRRWFLEEVKKIIGEGNVNDRKPTSKGSQVSDYCLIGPAAVGKFLKQIQPYLRIKQKQANLVIRIIEQLPHSQDQAKFIQLCEIVDQVSALNDSRNKIITAEIVEKRMNEALKEIVPVETSD